MRAQTTVFHQTNRAIAKPFGGKFNVSSAPRWTPPVDLGGLDPASHSVWREISIGRDEMMLTAVGGS